VRADGGRSRISPAFIVGTSGGGGSDGAGLALIFFVVHVKSNPSIFYLLSKQSDPGDAGYAVIMSNNAWYIL